MDEKRYCVTARVYVFADDEEDAAIKVHNDLDYLIEHYSRISGFQHPTEADVEKLADLAPTV